MKSNSIALGDRHYEGSYNRLAIAGDATITNSEVNKVYCAGDLVITRSSIRNLKFAGDLVADTFTVGMLRGAGDATLSGICKVDNCLMLGNIECDMLECVIMQNGPDSEKIMTKSNRTPTWSGVFKGETFENFGELDVDGELDFKNIILSHPLSINSEISCENFYLLGGLTFGSVNAEKAFILASSNVKLDSITGGTITVKKAFKPDKEFKNIKKNGKYKNLYSDNSITTIDSIEADYIYVENAKCKNICGINVVIGPLCIVDRVEYQDTIDISDKAIVNEVIKS